MEVKIREVDGKSIDDLLIEIEKDGNASINRRFNKVWFGFKDARDAVEKYEIEANGIIIDTQNIGCEESFLTSLCANETTKRVDVYSKARHKDIWNNKSGSRIGFFVEFLDKK